MTSYQPNNLRRTELVYNRYTEIAAPGESLDDVMNADKWINVRKMLRVHDIIEIIAADGTYEALLRVTTINQLTGAIKFRVVAHITGEAVALEPVAAGDRYEVRHAGHGKWRVIERQTGQTVADGLDRAGADAAKAEAEMSRKAA